MKTKALKNPTFAVTLIVVVLTVIAFKPAVGSIAKPSAPEFAVKLVDKSYDAPASTYIDPYTGNNVTKPSYHVDDRSIQIVIDNQAYNSYLYYDVRTKGHFEENWTTRFGLYNSPKMTTDAKTVLTFSPAGEDEWAIHYPSVPGTNIIYGPPGGQIDFQLKAFIADYEPIESQPGAPAVGGSQRFTLESESDWSSTQTLTIGANSSTTSSDASNPTTSLDANDSTTTPNVPSSQNPMPNPPSSPTSPNNSSINQINIYGLVIAILIVLIGVTLLIVGIVFTRRKTR